jgi:hypothetical protein
LQDYFAAKKGKDLLYFDNESMQLVYDQNYYNRTDIPKYDFFKLISVLNYLDDLISERKVVYVTFYIKTISDETLKVIMNGFFTMKPDELSEILVKYDTSVVELNLRYYEEKEIPIQGACDSRPHVVKMYFDCDDQKIELVVQSVKSSGDNCLINAMSQANSSLGRGFRAESIRKTLNIPSGAISSEWCQ